MTIKLNGRLSQAQKNGTGIVALESTIITHGMPYPENLETALEVESIIRDGGCEPATIAVMNGTLTIGMDEAELQKLAHTSSVMKLSRADLPFAISTGATGSTTVAATMIAAQLAGIHYFATGGIGGVHRGASQSMDISADLAELGRTTVSVVCAGAKAILDIPLTLEVLETHGVPVITYQSDDLPAFWSRSCGIKTPLRLDTAEAIESFVYTREKLQIQAGTLIANPVPLQDEIPHAQIAQHIQTALEQAHNEGINGKAVTPFLLSRMNELTGGESLRCNIALIKNNAKLATELANVRAKRLEAV